MVAVRTDTFRSEPWQRCNGVSHAHVLLRSPNGVCAAPLPDFASWQGYRDFLGTFASRIVRFQTTVTGNNETFTSRRTRRLTRARYGFWSALLVRQNHLLWVRGTVVALVTRCWSRVNECFKVPTHCSGDSKLIQDTFHRSPRPEDNRI